MSITKRIKNPYFLLLLLIILTIPALLPLFHRGFFLTDDGEWMIIRFSAFHQMLRGGQLPVRFLDRLNHGYGYPVATFLYPGFMYLAEPFKVLGLGFVNAIKVVAGLSILGSAVGTFFWLAKRVSVVGALIGALVYVYTPYHLYDLYTRGSIGEVLALAVMPCVLWQIERKSVGWASLGIGLLLLSHNTLAVLFLPVIAIYMLLIVQSEKHIRQTLFHYASMLGFGFGLSAFFWLPALLELSYTKFSTVRVSEVKNYFASLPLLGSSSLFILGISLFVLYKQRKDSSTNRVFLFFIGLSILSICFATGYSAEVWSVLPSAFIQFPFRLLSYLVLAISFVTAYCVTYYDRTAKVIVCMMLCIVLGYSAVPYMQPKEYFDKGEAFYATNEDTTTVKNEYMPQWVKDEAKIHPTEKVVSVDKTVDISNVLVTPGKVLVSVQSPKNTLIMINTLYYPGWTATVNGQSAPISYSNNYGIIGVPISKGNSTIMVTFAETFSRMMADGVSILSVITLIGVILMRNKKRRQHANT